MIRSRRTHRGLYSTEARGVVSASIATVARLSSRPDVCRLLRFLVRPAGILTVIVWVGLSLPARAPQVPLWTTRAMGPALLFYVHPFLAVKWMDGEQKGCDMAMLQITRNAVLAGNAHRRDGDAPATTTSHTFQKWPFFSVKGRRFIGPGPMTASCMRACQ